MEIGTERVELGGGRWAELYVELLRKTARLHEAELRKHMRPMDEEPLLMSEIATQQKTWPNDFVINPAAVDQGRIAELYMLHQVKAWSLGPVDQDTIDCMPKAIFDELRAEIDRRYEAPPLPVRDG